MGVSISAPILMHCDNKSVMAIASNPVFHTLTKNIEVDCHITRQEYEKGKIILLYLSGAISWFIHQGAYHFLVLQRFIKLSVFDPPWV